MKTRILKPQKPQSLMSVNLQILFCNLYAINVKVSKFLDSDTKVYFILDGEAIKY